MRSAPFLNAAQREAFAEDVRALLFDLFQIGEDRIIKGQSFSFLQRHLVSDGNRRWKNLSDYRTARDAFEAAGFKIADGKHKRRGYRAEVVFEDHPGAQS